MFLCITQRELSRIEVVTDGVWTQLLRFYYVYLRSHFPGELQNRTSKIAENEMINKS